MKEISFIYKATKLDIRENSNMLCLVPKKFEEKCKEKKYKKKVKENKKID